VRLENILHYVDAHAEGETSRVVLGGIIDVPGETMAEKRRHVIEHRDDLRRFLLSEPRGTVTLCADIVLPSTHPDADFGYIIIEPTDYPPVSGTNTINTATVLLETGLIPMHEPVTRFNLEAPGGLIAITAHCHDGKCERVTFTNRPAFATHIQTPLQVPGLGELIVDVAYGGGFFVFVDAGALGFSVVPEEAAELARLGQVIKRAAAEQFPISHPENPDFHTVTFCCFLAAARAGGHGGCSATAPTTRARGAASSGGGGSRPGSPGRRATTAPGSGANAGWSSARSPGCTSTGGCASASSAAPTSTRRSCTLPAA
jgi:proline racemase